MGSDGDSQRKVSVQHTLLGDVRLQGNAACGCSDVVCFREARVLKSNFEPDTILR